jgi:prolyl-tRNA synthetase
MNIEKSSLMKSILFIVESNPVFALIPGDREIDENKLSLIWGEKFRYANEEEIEKHLSAPKGYISPVGKSIKTFADHSLNNRVNLVSGANKKDYHFTGIDVARDLESIEFADLIKINDKDKCPDCGGELRVAKTIEIGHIFQLGTKYSEPMQALFLDSDGSRKPIVMGSYGIGLGRVASTIAEQYNDKDGLKWPMSVAPFKVIVIPLNTSEENQMTAARKLYEGLKAFDALLDDRDISPGVKFKDSDLVGIPVKVIFGRSFASENKVEIQLRKDNSKLLVSLEDAEETIKKIIKEEMEKYNAV